MRTNIVLDDVLLEKAKRLSGISTKKGVVDEAMKNFIRILSQQEIKKYKGKLKWEGDLEQSRAGR